MADDLDRAAELEDAEREAALARARARGYRGRSAERCEACGEEIPAARRRLLPGVRRCVECRAWDERRERSG